MVNNEIMNSINKSTEVVFPQHALLSWLITTKHVGLSFIPMSLNLVEL